MNKLSKTVMAMTVAVTGALAGVTAASAQSPCPACGSQVKTSDIDKTIADSALAMGLVRSIANQVGQMNNYEMVGAGTMVDLEAATLGAAVPVSRWVFNVHQQQWASRTDVTGAGGARMIRVVKGPRAWDETWVTENAKAGPINKLKTAAADNAAALRAALVWLEPHAFISHAAFASGKKCMAAEVKACTTPVSVTQDNGKTVITVEINGAAYKGTLDANKRVGSVETTVKLLNGQSKKIVATYTGYRTGEGDSNDPRNLAAFGDKALDKFHNGVFWPESIVWDMEGAKVLDIRLSEGWNNPYTIYPEPELLAKAQ